MTASTNQNRLYLDSGFLQKTAEITEILALSTPDLLVIQAEVGAAIAGIECHLASPEKKANAEWALRAKGKLEKLRIIGVAIQQELAKRNSGPNLLTGSVPDDFKDPDGYFWVGGLVKDDDCDGSKVAWFFAKEPEPSDTHYMHWQAIPRPRQE